MHAREETKLFIVGVSHFSDLYPNVLYKPEVFSEFCDLHWRTYDLGQGGLYSNVAQRKFIAKFLGALNLLWGHLKIFLLSPWRSDAIVYVVYPGVFLVNLYSLLPSSWRPKIILDAFISVYDTSVHDRGMLRPSNWLARVLYRLEKRAINTADIVMVDTRQNADYYSDLFAVNRQKFIDVPLSIPKLKQATGSQPGRVEFTCMFIGSMVPLQGIGTILDAARILKDEKGIKFVLIGDGQESTKVRSYLEENTAANLDWTAEMLSTADLVEQLSRADLCLGIFGQTAKADRVIPYKIYYYSALGKAFLSKDSPALQSLGRYPALSSSDAETLATQIKNLRDNPDALTACQQASGQLFHQYLDREVQAKKCKAILDSITQGLRTDRD